jgi:hypothetical protein
MSLLTLVQRFTDEINVDRPSTVMGTTDPQIRQIKALLEKELYDLAGRGDWEALVNEATHTTLAQEDQGAIDDIATNGFRYIKNDTIWDRNLRLPVYVIDATDWQQVKAIAVTGPRYQARIRGGKLLANPVPTAGNTWAFEYISWRMITDSTGVTQKRRFSNDDDLMLLPELLVEAGLQWRWKKQKGMEYAEDFRTYEHMVANELSRNGLKRPLNLSQTNMTPEPKIYVPEGNWNL